MCGIFGVISDERPVIIDKLQSVSESIKHRGPDSEGFALIDGKEVVDFGGINTTKQGMKNISHAEPQASSCLLHRRLSIIDLTDQGHQPMRYQSSNVWLTFNGEVYNYKEIRSELSAKGYVFKSATDSEVILASYIEWGADCVKKFNGMWAFAIWDGRDNSWFLSRDRLGIKPLYYTNRNGQILFASEIKAMLTYDDSFAVLNKRKTAEYLELGQIIIGESKETMFQGVFQLMPGYNMVVKNGQIILDEYWSLEIDISNRSRIDHLEEFESLFEDSVRLRMQSDVELGSCLSGGIDSSSIVAVATKLKQDSINTFSAVWPGTRHDERSFMEKMNAASKSNAHYVTIEEENIANLIDQVTWHQEIPLAGSSLLAQWTVMKAARGAAVPVLLDGQGADEVLSGYPNYQIVYFNELLKTFNIRELRKLLNTSEFTGITSRLMLKRHLKNFMGKIPARSIPNSLKEYSSSTLKYSHPLDCFSLPKYLVYQITTSNLPSLLHFEDRNSMAHSVEARVPFLDHRIVEMGVNIPSSQKLNDGFTKTILRDTMKGLVPDEIVNRRDKVGFSTPLEDNLGSSSKSFLNVIQHELDSSSHINRLGINIQQLNVQQKFRAYLLSRFVETFKLSL